MSGACTFQYRIPEESLLSIYSQLVRVCITYAASTITVFSLSSQLHTKRTYWQHNKLKTKLEYYQRCIFLYETDIFLVVVHLFSYLVARETGTGTGDLLLQLAEKVCPDFSYMDPI